MKNMFSYAAIVLGLAAAGSARAALINVTYVGPSGGAWATPNNWSPVGVPNNGANTYNVLIDGTAANIMVNLTGTQTISGLTVDAGDGIAIANGARLRLRNDGSASFTNNGVIALVSSGSDTYLQPVEGPVTLLGTGELTLTDNPNNWIYRADTNGFLINGASHTIRGAGNLGWSGSPTAFTNDGTVLAEGAVNPLIVDCSAGVTNNGLMQASTGTLRIQGNGTLDNTAGVIEALNGEVVELGGITVTGGELTSAGAGVIRSISANPTLDGSASTIINNAAIEIPNNFRLRLSGEVENNGSIALLSATSDTYLQPLDGPVTLSGDGEITLTDSPDNWIYKGNSTGALVNSASHTIRGAGNLGWSGSPTAFTNDGTVLAEGAVNPLIVDCSAGVTNNGLMQASTGTLRIQGNGTLDNTAGVIEALNGEVVELGGITVTGGELTSAGTGVIRSISNSASVDGSTSTVTNNAAIEIPNNFRLRLSGEVENNGSIALQDSGSDTYLQPLDGPATLSGDGELTLTDSPNNWIYKGNSTGALVNGPSHTIRGAGNLGWSGSPTAFTNQGTVIADSTTNSLRIDCSHASGVTNQGLIQVTGAAPLLVSGANFNNQGNVTIDATRSLTRSGGAYNQTGGTTTVVGTLTLQAPATLTLNGGVLKGTGNVAGTTTNSGGAVEPGASVGNLMMTTYTQNAGSRLRIEVADDAKGQHDKLVVSGTATLGGTLEIVPVSGYTPTPGDSFTILTAGTRTGTFQAVTDGYCVTYDATSATVSMVDTCAADLTGCDANVNVDDLVAVILGWGPCPTVCPPGCAADANDDCNVDVDDLVAVILGWGSCP